MTIDGVIRWIRRMFGRGRPTTVGVMDGPKQYQVGEVYYYTAAEALAAWTKAVGPRDPWLSGHRIGSDELKWLAHEEATAPDPEEVP